jgi:TolA-binding protein
MLKTLRSRRSAVSRGFEASLSDRYQKIPIALSVLAVLSLTVVSACATGRSKQDQEELNALRNQVGEMRTALAALSSRIETVEVKAVANEAPAQKPRPAPQPAPLAVEPVPVHPAEGAGKAPKATSSPRDPDGALVNDDAIQDYRKAMIQFRAAQYADSALAFSAFLEKYPDHPLAGGAQYFVGKSYMNQGEFKLALQELGRVLTSYDRSSHVAATLRDLADVEEALKKPEDAARHRQLLLSLFPHSPESVRSEKLPVQRDVAPAKASIPAERAAPEEKALPGPAGAQRTPTAPVASEPLQKTKAEPAQNPLAPSTGDSVPGEEGVSATEGGPPKE